MTTSEKLIEAAKTARKAKGLFVRIIADDGAPFDYYPANETQKADFIRRSLANGRTILES